MHTYIDECKLAKGKKEGNRKEKRGEIEKRKKDAVNSPQQNRSETTTAITDKIENYTKLSMLFYYVSTRCKICTARSIVMPLLEK